jgi:hypothetical protein
MDNASYHSVIKEGTKAPTSATRKGDMQKWLIDKKFPFDGKMKKTELYEIILYIISFKSVIFPSNITLDILPYHFDRVKFTMVWGEAENIMTFPT